MTEKDFLRAVKGADRSFFQQAAARAADPQGFAAQHGGKRMKSAETTRKIKRAVIGALIAAAVLGGGTIAMSVAMHGHLGGYYKYDGSSTRTDSVQTPPQLNLTAQEYDSATHLFQSDYHARMWYTPSETGWYHQTSNFPYVKNDEGYDYETINAMYGAAYDHFYASTYATGGPFISYCDAKTGKDVPLCDRANCLHKADPFCEASAHERLVGGVVYHDGVLYGAERSSEDAVSLYSFELNGTGVKELAKISCELGDVGIQPVVHRGYVWFEVDLVHLLDDYDPMIDERKNHFNRGYAIYGYEIATGKTVELYRHMPDKDSTDKYRQPSNLTAGGDYLIYSLDGSDEIDGMTRASTGIYAINLVTGKQEKLVSGNSVEQIVYAVRGNMLYYPETTPSKTTVCRLNLDTREKETFCTGSFYEAVVTDQYFISIKPTVTKAEQAYYISVYNLSGELLQRVAYDPERVLYFLTVHDGYVYAVESGSRLSAEIDHEPYETSDNRNEVLRRCKLDDLAAGSPQWEDVVILMEMHDLSAE